jgi:hypothetical protein
MPRSLAILDCIDGGFIESSGPPGYPLLSGYFHNFRNCQFSPLSCCKKYHTEETAPFGYFCGLLYRFNLISDEYIPPDIRCCLAILNYIDGGEYVVSVVGTPVSCGGPMIESTSRVDPTPTTDATAAICVESALG